MVALVETFCPNFPFDLVFRLILLESPVVHSDLSVVNIIQGKILAYYSDFRFKH